MLLKPGLGSRTGLSESTRLCTSFLLLQLNYRRFFDVVVTCFASLLPGPPRPWGKFLDLGSQFTVVLPLFSDLLGGFAATSRRAMPGWVQVDICNTLAFYPLFLLHTHTHTQQGVDRCRGGRAATHRALPLRPHPTPATTYHTTPCHPTTPHPPPLPHLPAPPPHPTPPPYPTTPHLHTHTTPPTRCLPLHDFCYICLFHLPAIASRRRTPPHRNTCPAPLTT